MERDDSLGPRSTNGFNGSKSAAEPTKRNSLESLMTQQTEGIEKMEQSLIDIAVESWRFSRLFGKVVGKLDAGESGRYINQIR